MQHHNGKPFIFLDTDVLDDYLHRQELEPTRKASFRFLFDEMGKKLRFAVNPVVLQELLFLERLGQPMMGIGSLVQEINTIRISGLEESLDPEIILLPLNLEKAEEYLAHAPLLRDRIAHSNDILILSSAAECDYLVSDDGQLKNALNSLSIGKPQVVTPEELLVELGSKV
ncbi:MAG: type II toxin-antitoxin system VapC family toxin [Chloroflexaceae bacterium]|nr:type II toxin-antitoxin system VapC family toxin [Chloroflexaceae bacterium]